MTPVDALPLQRFEVEKGGRWKMQPLLVKELRRAGYSREQVLEFAERWRQDLAERGLTEAPFGEVKSQVEHLLKGFKKGNAALREFEDMAMTAIAPKDYVLGYIQYMHGRGHEVVYVSRRQMARSIANLRGLGIIVVKGRYRSGVGFSHEAVRLILLRLVKEGKINQTVAVTKREQLAGKGNGYQVVPPL